MSESDYAELSAAFMRHASDADGDDEMSAIMMAYAEDATRRKSDGRATMVYEDAGAPLRLRLRLADCYV